MSELDDLFGLGGGIHSPPSDNVRKKTRAEAPPPDPEPEDISDSEGGVHGGATDTDGGGGDEPVRGPEPGRVQAEGKPKFDFAAAAEALARGGINYSDVKKEVAKRKALPEVRRNPERNVHQGDPESKRPLSLPVLQRGGDGGGALQSLRGMGVGPVQPEGEGHEASQENSEAQDPVAESVAGSIHNRYALTEQGAFFPPQVGEIAGQVEAQLKDTPWVLRNSSTIEHNFPESYEEHEEDYRDQLKGIIPRMGAKSKLRDWLIPRFPQHHTYIEPFGGSFKILLWKSKRSKIEIINDIDGDLIHFFRYVTFFPEEVAELVNTLPTHKGILNALRDELRKGDLSGIERAAAVYYSIKLSFNGTGNGYAGSVQSLASARADPGEFRRVADRLRGVDIRNESAHDVIRSTVRRLDHFRYPGGIFYYLDPPYHDTAGYKTLTGSSVYGEAMQNELFFLAKKIHETGNKFMMTNSYTTFLRKMWCKVDGWDFVKRKVKYDISGDADSRKETEELIVANFPIGKKAAQTGGLFK
jgi:DNA adenine methylase